MYKSENSQKSFLRSPLYNHVTNSMAGYLSIKAYGLQVQTTFQFNELQDLHGGAWLLFCATSRWLAIRLDSIIAIYITIVAGTADFFQVKNG